MELLGLMEVAQVLGMSKKGAWERTLEDDFPRPAADLASGRVWRRIDLVRYARMRCSRFHEREALQRLADETIEPVRFSELLTSGQETRS